MDGWFTISRCSQPTKFYYLPKLIAIGYIMCGPPKCINHVWVGGRGYGVGVFPLHHHTILSLSAGFAAYCLFGHV